MAAPGTGDSSSSAPSGLSEVDAEATTVLPENLADFAELEQLRPL